DSSDYTDYAIADVVRASTAAPTYFPAKKILENKRPNNYIDGGVFMNNPVFKVYLKAKQAEDKPDENVEYVVCSLGTGIYKGETFNSLAEKGELKWAAPLISLMMDASSELAENNFSEFVNPTNKEKIIKDATYYRIQATLKKEIPLDAVDDQSMEYLKEAAKEAIAKKRFDEL
ncbi:7715_t:CDS:1, partial [Racocetra fulgida]